MVKLESTHCTKETVSRFREKSKEEQTRNEFCETDHKGKATEVTKGWVELNSGDTLQLYTFRLSC